MFFSFVSIFAFISWLVFLNKKKYNYAEHLVLNLYAYAQISIVVVILYFLSIWNAQLYSYVALLSLPLQIILYAYIAKRVFHLSFKQLSIKILYFLVIARILYIILSIVLLILLLITGTVELKDFAPPKGAIETAVYYYKTSVANWTS